MFDEKEIKTVYAYATNGKFISQKVLDYTDRSPISGTWQIPAQCTEIAPLKVKEGFDVVFKNSAWDYQEIPKREEPIPQTPTIEDKTNLIKSKYEQQIADLKDALATATLASDTTSIEELKKEYAELMKKYESELEGLSNAEKV